jgi:hypothetical protein
MQQVIYRALLEWRLTVETDTELNTFLLPDSQKASRYSGRENATYWDGNVDEKTFVHGQTETFEEDDDWYYYTFKISNEGLEQLGIKSYDVLDIQLVNTRIKRQNKQVVSFSRISGIYKPFGVNLVCKVRIFKNPNGLDAYLEDHEYIDLLDEDGNRLYY